MVKSGMTSKGRNRACFILEVAPYIFFLSFSEISKGDNRLFFNLFTLDACWILDFARQVVAKDKDAYQYLVESIRMFPV